MRITAGTLKGRKFPVSSGTVRPTSSRAREAVFNILADDVPGSRFLDLFAGSGIMSVEALSRGAREAVAVDSSGKAVAELDAQAKKMTLPLTVRRMDALRFIAGARREEPFDVVYADPPYDYAGYDDLLIAIDRQLPLTPGAVVLIEHRKKRDPFEVRDPERLVHRDSRSWGQVSVELFDALERNFAIDR